MRGERVWRICQRVARGLWYREVPTEGYVRNVAGLLFGTAAQESALVYERQLTPRWEGDVGGFSKWQLEKASVLRGIEEFRKKEEYGLRATRLVFGDRKANLSWLGVSLETLLWALRMDDNDMLGCVLAREHYRRCPGLVPETVAGQAWYWKKWYNTHLGKGTEEQYIGNWNRLCRPVVDSVGYMTKEDER